MSDIFVFGSNLAGRHGAGSALEARKRHGAKQGVGVGPSGNSYAIPTKDENLKVLPLEVIERHVSDFVSYAERHPDDMFNVVAIGCGLAGYTPLQIAPFFADPPDNVKLPKAFWDAFDVLYPEVIS